MTSVTILLWNIAMTPNPPPNINTRAAKQRAPLIAAILNRYDIVVLNESFLYRNYLLSFIQHSYIHTDPRIWYKPLNSGVVILSKIPFKNTNYVHYSKAATWDWFTSKGLVGCSFEIGGYMIDLYGTHMQAGNQATAQNARFQQAIELVQQVVKTHDETHELLVCGDFNCGQVYDPTFKKYTVHFSDEQDARQRHKQYMTIVNGLNATPILATSDEDDISSFLYNNRSPNITVERLPAPDISYNQNLSLSDTCPIVIKVSVNTL